MNKHYTQSILKILLLIVTALSSGCGAATAIPAPTLTPTPSQTPTETETPSPTNTPEPMPIHPKGTIFYFADNAIYSVDLKSQQTKAVIQLQPLSYYFIANIYIYTKLISKVSNLSEVFKINLDGSQPEQLTTGRVIEAFNTDPNGKYLMYNTGERILKMLDIATKTSEVIAKPSKDSEWVWAFSWSPDGTKLLYGKKISFVDSCAFFIYDINEKKSAAILPDKQVSCNANWSPDGIFISVAMNETNMIGLYLWNVKDNSIKQVLLNADRILSNGFIWDLNGKRILVSTSKSIYRYEVDSEILDEIFSSRDLSTPAIISPNRPLA